MSIRVLVCHDDPIMRAALGALLDQQPDLRVVGETTGHRAVAAAHETTPDVVLVAAPALTIEHRRELRELAAHRKVILIAEAADTHRSLEALSAGVHAVLSSESSAQELVRGLRMVTEGEFMVVPAAARPSLDRILDRPPSELAVRVAGTLTRREREVMLLLAEGRSNADIASELSISMATARSHVHHLLRKLGTGTRAQAVAMMYENGLIGEMRKHSNC